MLLNNISIITKTIFIYNIYLYSISWGGPPWGHLKPPPKLEKPCRSQNCMCGGRHFACSGQHFACSGWHFACRGWHGKKLLAQENFFTFLKIFLSFLGFSMVKIHFFQKVLKKWSSFRKKLLYFFPLLGGRGVQTQKWKFPLFFWTLPLLIYFFIFWSTQVLPPR